MRSYRLKARAKLGAEINIARLLQPPRPDQVRCTDLHPLPAAPLPQQGEGKTEALISGRRRKAIEEPGAPDYELRCEIGRDDKGKRCMWRGRCDDSTKFAVAYVEDQEVRLSLVDHWYKFTRISSDSAPVSGPSDVPEAAYEPRKRSRKERDNDEENSVEELDYEAEFEDDEEGGEASYEDQGNKLTASGKALEQALRDQSEASDSANDDQKDDIGLESSSDEEQNKKQALSKPLFLREMQRLGKIEKGELLRRLIAKFDLKGTDAQKRLAEYLRKYTDEFQEDSTTVYVLKAECGSARAY